MLTLRYFETNKSLRQTKCQFSEQLFVSRLKSVRRNFSYTAPKMYRTLKEELKRMKSLDRFKRKRKTSVFWEINDLEVGMLDLVFVHTLFWVTCLTQLVVLNFCHIIKKAELYILISVVLVSMVCSVWKLIKLPFLQAWYTDLFFFSFVMH